MRLVRLSLINVNLMLLTLGTADAVNINLIVGTYFTMPIKEVVAPLKLSTGDEARLNFGARRWFCTQAMQTGPPQASTAVDDFRPSNPVEHGNHLRESSFICAIGMRRSPITTFLNGAETLKMSPIVTLPICNLAAAPNGATTVSTSRWSETSWLAGGMVMLAFVIILLVTLIDKYSASMNR
ncbi:hypothetical protein ACFFWD_31210 [Bradyrhizobium erythrophlei]|uniref:hypothetical protein n=1 Tax=Bradyrhizobium erythrophlei TaxID=1437360 RepID=UPI0035EC83C8